MRKPITDAELAALRINRRDPNYGPGYFKFADGDHGPASELFGDVLWDIFHPTSAVDFGCGTAGTLAALKRHGVIVQAVDGSEAVAPFIARRDQELADQLIVHDLSKPVALPLSHYDLAISTECFEHLPPESSEVIVKTISDCTDVAVVTACGPTGKNALHTNERLFEFWVDLFAQQGLLLAHDKTAQLRRIMREYKDKIPAVVPIVPSWYYSGYIGVFCR